ncbi:MAG: DNA translocase FtsK [Oscillospiraceae bacterium]|jgi:S-DNA-T family DNA segregation ATPase FtsK/SpoIIIE|nr:DNA translocase FtsK [Oscillospiraceae bacterium]
MPTTAKKPTAKKPAAKKSAASKPAPKTAKSEHAARSARPIRRGVGAFLCLTLAIFAFIGYSTSDAVFIVFLRGTSRGLLGSAFYVLPILLLYCAFVLAFHRGRPVMSRVVTTLLLGVVVAALIHLFGGERGYTFDSDIIKTLWADGKSGIHGGLLGALLALALIKLVSPFGAGTVFFLAALFLCVAASGHSLTDIADAIRSRPRREYEPQPERERPPRPAPAPKPERRRAVDLALPDINTPVVTDPYSYREPESAPVVVLGADNADLSDDEQDAHRGLISNDDYDSPFVRSGKREAPRPVSRALDSAFDAALPVDTAAVHANPKPPKPSKKPEITPEPVSYEAEVAETPIPDGAYAFPPISLLTPQKYIPQGEGDGEVRQNVERLETAFRDFGVNVRVKDATRGPSVTRYEAELESGVKLSRVVNLSDDIALALGSSGVRIAPMADKRSTVGVEVPNKLVSTVHLREIIESREFQSAAGKLTFAIGKNIPGEAVVGNISKLPHLLIAGTTGSGKSMCLNSLILSILFKATPEEVRFIMIDPKMVEFRVYNGIPHLLTPVVTDAKKAAGALQYSVIQMEKRYHLFSEVNARDLESYNRHLEQVGEPKMSQLVVVIDELADLMMTSKNEVEESIVRVAQKGRAAGVHLVIATQSPRADVITGLMKANIPARIALKVASGLESRIILDTQGAEKLVGNGDMLFSMSSGQRGIRIQGTFLSEPDREAVIEYIKRGGEAQYETAVIDEIERAAYANDKKAKGAKSDDDEDGVSTEFDELLPQAAEVIFEFGRASTTMLQTRLRLGYSRASRLIDQLETVGLLGPFEGAKGRQILITKEQWAKTRYAMPIDNGQLTIDNLDDDEDDDAPF